MHSVQFAIHWILRVADAIFKVAHPFLFSFDFWIWIKSDDCILCQYNYTHKSGVHKGLEIPMLYVSGIYIKDSSERINVYGQGFPLHSANTVFAKTNCSYSSCPLMSFSKFILTSELKMKWEPAGFIIIVLSFPPFPSVLLHIGVIRFTSSLDSDSPSPMPTGIFLYLTIH